MYLLLACAMWTYQPALGLAMMICTGVPPLSSGTFLKVYYGNTVVSSPTVWTFIFCLSIGLMGSEGWNDGSNCTLVCKFLNFIWAELWNVVWDRHREHHVSQLHVEQELSVLDVPTQKNTPLALISWFSNPTLLWWTWLSVYFVIAGEVMFQSVPTCSWMVLGIWLYQLTLCLKYFYS